MNTKEIIAWINKPEHTKRVRDDYIDRGAIALRRVCFSNGDTFENITKYRDNRNEECTVECKVNGITVLIERLVYDNFGWRKLS